MVKIKKTIIVSLLLSLLTTNLFYAGEFKYIDDKLYFHSGTKDEINGWTWIVSTDSQAYLYFLTNGYVFTNVVSPDGYSLDEKGRYVLNGVLATSSIILDEMYKETNWDNFNGSFHVSKLIKTDSTIQEFGQYEWPVKVSEDNEGISIAWNGLYKDNQIFEKSNEYSLQSRQGTYINVIDENNFTMLLESGEELIVIKN